MTGLNVRIAFLRVEATAGTSVHITSVQKGLFTLIYTFLCPKVWMKAFLRAEKQLAAECFGVPTFKQSLSFNVGIKCPGWFLLLFLAGVCGMPKRFCEGSNGRKSNTSRVQIGARMKKLQVKGSFFLKDKGRFFKVITVRPVGDNRYVFGCRELDSKKSEVLTFRLLGLLDAMEAAASVTRDPKDILLVEHKEETTQIIKEMRMRKGID